MSDPIDTFSEVTTRSWGSKIGGALLGMVLGPLLIVGACIGLFWNEGRAVQTARSLSEGAALVVDAAASPVVPANEGKLVHVSGELKAGAKLTDPEFAVSGDAVRLLRRVEMYQWKEESKSETRKNLGGSEETTTTYTYRREWSDRPVDSAKFRQPAQHENPPMRFAARDVVASDATLGAFRLGPLALRRFNADHKLEVDPAVAETVRKNTGRAAIVTSGQIYLTENPDAPKVGDYRISYRIVPIGEGSVVARQSGSELTGYQSQAGDVILLARTGAVPAADMFKAAQDQNRVLTWILRAVCALVMFFGFVLLMGPLVAITDFLPFFGNLLQAGAFVFAFLFTAILAPVTIAIAWLFFRPLISAIVLAIGALLVYAALKLIRARRAERAPAGAAARPTA